MDDIIYPGSFPGSFVDVWIKKLIRDLSEVLRWSKKVEMDDNPDELPIQPKSIINLRTGMVKKRTKNDYFTMECPVSHNDKYNREYAQKYFLSLMSDDIYMTKKLQKHCGYLLTGRGNGDIYIWYGLESTGRSTLLQIIGHILGSTNRFGWMLTRFYGCDSDWSYRSYIEVVSITEKIDSPKYIVEKNEINQIDKRYIFRFTNIFNTPNFIEELDTHINDIFSYLVEGAIEYYKDRNTLKGICGRKICETKINWEHENIPEDLKIYLCDI